MESFCQLLTPWNHSPAQCPCCPLSKLAAHRENQEVLYSILASHYYWNLTSIINWAVKGVFLYNRSHEMNSYIHFHKSWVCQIKVCLISNMCWNSLKFQIWVWKEVWIFLKSEGKFDLDLYLCPEITWGGKVPFWQTSLQDKAAF